MVSVTKEKKGGTIRINVSAKEFANLIPADSNAAIVKNWIEKGRERESILAHLDEVLATQFAAQRDEIAGLQRDLEALKNTLNSFVSLFAQVAHTLTISTTARSHFDLEAIHFDKVNGNKLSHEHEQVYKLAQIKHSIYKQLLAQLFPDIDPRFTLTNYLRDEEQKDA